jgi:hypothetical protein
LGAAASGIDRIAKQDELGVPIGSVGLLRENLRPGILHIVEHEGDKLHERFFLLVLSGIRLADAGLGIRDAATAEQGEEVCFEHEAENQEDDGPANPDVNAAKIEAATTAATGIAIVFNIGALAAGRPSHRVFSSTDPSTQQRGKSPARIALGERSIRA